MKLTYQTYSKLTEVYEKVKKTFGPSTHYDGKYPALVMLWDKYDTTFGTFESNPLEITINVALCRSWKCLIRTLLHEYKHYLQHPGNWDFDFEKEAKDFEENLPLITL